jgi:transcriptional regulator with XRE-family HTH domain
VVDDLARLVGERLRAARRERGLSVGALADAAGVGKGSLSEIENGIRNPTLSTLYSVAGALGVPLASLIADQAGVRVTSPGVEARLLDVTRDGRQTVEVYRLRIEPGVHYRSVAHGTGVVEHMLMTAGRALVGRLGEETEIGAGSAAQWVSDVPHAYTALGTAPLESVLVIRSPVGDGLASPANHVGVSSPDFNTELRHSACNLLVGLVAVEPGAHQPALAGGVSGQLSRKVR